MKREKKLARQWARNACMGIAGMLCLAACASAPAPVMLTRNEVERVTVPAALLTVAVEPGLPGNRMESGVADYIVRLKGNDDECHLDVAAIAKSQQ